MPAFIDRSGMRYGHLMVLAPAGKNALNKLLWSCLCDCGKTTAVPSGDLATGNTTSCGCKSGFYKHGGSGKGSYNTWRAMVRRCTNPADKDYVRYGARGLSVCERWLDYTNFAADMGEPTGAQTLDRIDTYKGYSPENCRWAAPIVQARNRRPAEKNASGYLGVRKAKSGRWYAVLQQNGAQYTSKLFDTAEEAAVARKLLEAVHWGAC